MLKMKSLRTQFVVTFVLIIALSLIATVLTYLFAIHVYSKLEYVRMYPANHFEKLIPPIETEIRSLGTSVMQYEGIVASLLPEEGITYQVLDMHGHSLFGSEHSSLGLTSEEIFAYINTTTFIGGKFMRFVPLFSSEGQLEGVVTLGYHLTPHYPTPRDRMVLVPLGYLAVFSPFIFIVCFTLLFVRRLTRSIGEPVNMLIEASHKVKAQDLDFTIEYNAENELGKLSRAFEDMKEALKDSLLAQWETERQRQELVTALAHDLKTPFTLIQGYTQALLEDRSAPAKAIQYLGVIAENSRRGTELVQEMVYLAELENEVSLAPTNILWRQYLTEKLEVYQGLVAGEGIGMELNLAPPNDEPECLLLDQGKLDRILDNLVLNSLHYTPQGGTVTLSAEVESHELRLMVCDAGPGFSAQDLEHLFEPFYRGDQARRPLGGKSGLGLPIVKRLVQQHGGTVEAFNHEAGGACVRLSLPGQVE